jgi:hypothetical protein
VEAIGEVLWLVVSGIGSELGVETIKIVVGDVTLGDVAVAVIRSELLYLTSTIDAICPLPGADRPESKCSRGSLQ